MSLLSRFAHHQGSLKYAAVLSLALGVSTSLHAQQQAAPAQTGQASAAEQQGSEVTPPQIIKMIPTPGQAWTKLCGKDPNEVESCITTREFVIENGGRGIGIAVYDIKSKKPEQHARVMVPLGFKLPVGVKLGIGDFFKDKDLKMHNGYYDVCLPPGCYVNFQNAAELIKQMETGAEATLVVQDALSQPIFVQFPLEGFKEAFNGKPIDQEDLEKKRRQLEKELYEKSEQMRRNLLGEAAGDGNSDSSATAPQ